MKKWLLVLCLLILVGMGTFVLQPCWFRDCTCKEDSDCEQGRCIDMTCHTDGTNEPPAGNEPPSNNDPPVGNEPPSNNDPPVGNEPPSNNEPPINDIPQSCLVANDCPVGIPCMDNQCTPAPMCIEQDKALALTGSLPDGIIFNLTDQECMQKCLDREDCSVASNLPGDLASYCVLAPSSIPVYDRPSGVLFTKRDGECTAYPVTEG